MKDVPIKFKGESAIGTIYGYYVEREGKTYIVNTFGTWVSIDAESVAQLVGYDDEGNEIYENDRLIFIDKDNRFDKNEYEIGILANATIQAALKNDMVITMPKELDKRNVWLTPEQQLKRNAEFFRRNFKLAKSNVTCTSEKI